MTAGVEAVSIREQLAAYDAAVAELEPMYEDAEKTCDYSRVDDASTTINADYIDTFAKAARRYTNPLLWNVEAMQSEDPVKRDLELTCTLCKEHLCDVEASDILAVLLTTAIDHLEERHGAQEGQHP